MSHKKLFVIKIGTSSLTDKNGRLDTDKLDEIVRQVCVLKEEGHGAVIVTSGSVAAGFNLLGYVQRPKTVAARQASAAVGQGLLMQAYEKAFSSKGFVTAQILLTRNDFADKNRYKNAFNVIEMLVKKGVVPIINENDTVATHELKFGDNDTLSAQVASMVHSDMLILVTDIDGLYDKNPKTCSDAKKIEVVQEITQEIVSFGGGAGTNVGTGGMATKISAAKLATRSGVDVYICSSKISDSIITAAKFKQGGTLFCSKSGGMKTRLQWMAYFAECKGNLYIDKGAEEAVTVREKSLLLSGVVSCEGDFSQGDIVNVYSMGDHRYLGRGAVEYGKNDALRLMGKSGDMLNSCPEYRCSEIIHRDNWVGE